MATKAVMAWSGGKDSACALWRLQQDNRYEITGLLTTLTEGFDRISMHGVRRELLAAQAQALGLPVYEVWIPQGASNEIYEQRMGAMIERIVSEGVEAVAFGDLFLEDIRAYREKMLAPTGLEPLFPLWGAPTAALARRIIADGFRAVLTCVDPRAVPAEFAGREYDETLLGEMPPEADLCAERGEFHTFVYDAPNFAAPIAFTRGDVVEREGFVFADLLPA
ncbi:MAG: adenine nucleotide alpha hydrolase [Chloroflexi bacterium]|nr:adenine nucleotide alpha hydrolase [Chloroflexota bacterium]MCI0814963.1 adenine nucleotide alpha hydrolase [Chloroflexota bacterium]MCI0818236.1 adenine nucleotide alpha hydrolase [Chloroflexota bacterium]MCI0819334.1 adenine nucleotide alpha hydrolase [Chloroflexota bacterium]MCI0832654.1 adenine nucleotide alpha hydrolase [Chloroflexota bacterium]